MGAFCTSYCRQADTTAELVLLDEAEVKFQRPFSPLSAGSSCPTDRCGDMGEVSGFRLTPRKKPTKSSTKLTPRRKPDFNMDSLGNTPHSGKPDPSDNKRAKPQISKRQITLS